MMYDPLYSDYVKEAGKEPPYKELGFNTFLDYLKSIPDDVKLLNPHSRNSIVVGVASSKNAHIQKVVANNKVSNNSRNSRRNCPNRFSGRYLHEKDIHYHQYPKVFISASAQILILNYLQRNVKGVSRGEFKDFLTGLKEIDSTLKKDTPLLMRALRHLIFYQGERILANWHAEIIPDEYHAGNNFIQFNKLDLPTVKSHNVLEHEHQELEDIDKEDVESVVSSSSNSTVYDARDIPVPDISSRISPTLKKNLFGLLDKNPRGIWVPDLCTKYEKQYGYTLEVKPYGCYNLFQFVSQLPTIFYITKLSPGGHILLRDARKYKDDDEPPKVPKDIKDKIVDIIKKQVAIRVDELEKKYEELHGKQLVKQNYNFASLDHLILHLDDYIKIKAVGANLEWILDELGNDEVPKYLMINHCTSKEDYDLPVSAKDMHPEGVCEKGSFIPQPELPED